jgi:CDP-6-deoxy-D-xylo-4-hexulose-3-dehydrase
LPEPTNNTVPSWFGFLITVRDKSTFTRDDIVNHLENSKIQTRMLFAGNLLKHPCFDELKSRNQGYRIVGKLTNTDLIMNQAFWVGVYPGMTEAMLAYIVQLVRAFVKS